MVSYIHSSALFIHRINWDLGAKKYAIDFSKCDGQADILFCRSDKRVWFFEKFIENRNTFHQWESEFVQFQIVFIPFD